MSKAYLGIGSNLGDKKENINSAIELLKDNDSITVTKVSSIYETEPVGYLDQDLFLNVVCEIETGLLPYELLDCCNQIEAQLKRVRLIHWGPRTIDVDILLYDDLKLQEERLTIPHPRMKERAFVIIPLMELAPEITIDGEAIASIAEGLKDEGVRKIDD